MEPELAILTPIPSPYQVELCDALSTATGGRLSVIYQLRTAADRYWKQPRLHHDGHFLEDLGIGRALDVTAQARFAVISAYMGPGAKRIIAARIQAEKPWAFWGERPGVRCKGKLGRAVRAASQRRIRSSGVPIWGIGAWAVEGYREEIGEDRLYLNVPYFSNLNEYLAIDRSQYDRPPSRTRFLFSGSIIKRKGVDVLARAFKRVVASGTDADLTILGTGPLEDEVRVTLGSVADRVKFKGFVQWADLPGAYAQADVLCAPSRYDGWGLVVVEGLAAGMPVISTHTTGAGRELITDETGWLVPPNDEESLFKAMKAAANLDRANWRAFQVEGRRAALKQTVEAGVKRFLQAVEESKSYWYQRNL